MNRTYFIHIYNTLKGWGFYAAQLSLLLLFSLVVQAQNDSILSPTLLRLSANISSLSEELNDNEITTNLLISKMNETADFVSKYRTLNLHVFQERIPNSSRFYEYLGQLPTFQKNNLVLCFYQYEPFLSASLKEKDFPQELEFLVPALSGMNRRAVGEDKDAGLWQLSHFQAVLNGLHVDRLEDERFDAGRSTRAAIAELSKYRKVFGSDEKAVLAFLAGPTQLRNASSDLPESTAINTIIDRLPASVSEKIAMWQAMAVFLSENKPENMPVFTFSDTVFVSRQLHFQQVEQVLGIPSKTLQVLNPQYPYSIVPGGDRTCSLYLPKGKKADFLLFQDSINQAYDSTLFGVVAQKIEYPPSPTRQYVGEKVKDLEIEGKTKIRYTLKTGDVLGFIAEDYNVQVEDLKYWNNIYNERKIQAGQKLDIFVDDAEADYYRNLHPEPVIKPGVKSSAKATVYPIPESAKKIEHIVKSGESPYVIAQKYKGVTPEAILYWNGISDARKIQIGQKLIIYVTQ